MKRLTLLAVGLLAFSGVASAEGNEVAGVGGRSCGYYIENSANNSVVAGMFTSWAQGMLTGASMGEKLHGTPYLALPDSDAIKLYLDTYCQSHPLDGYAVGVGTMYHELRQRQAGGVKN